MSDEMLPEKGASPDAPEVEGDAGEETVENTESTEEGSENKEAHDGGHDEAHEEVELSIEEQISQLLKKKGGLRRKVNGKERVFESFEDMFKHVSMDMSADERFKAAQEMRKEAEAQMKAYKDGNLASFLKSKYGDLTADDTKKALLETIDMIKEEQGLTEEQKKLRFYEKQEEERKKREEEEKNLSEKQKEEARIEKIYTEILEEVQDASKKLGLPDDHLLLEQVFQELHLASQHDIDMKPEEAVRLVRDRAIGTSLDFVKSLNVEEIENILGDELIKKIRGRGVAKVKEAEKAFDTQADSKDSSQPKKAGKAEVKKVDLSGKGRYAGLFS